MAIKRTLSDNIADTIIYALLLGLTLITLYPMWHVIMASISEGNRLIRHQGLIILPLGLNLESYRLVLNNPSIITGYGNTLFYLITGTSLNLVLTTLGAYALSRREFLWRTPFMMLILFTMFFSGGMIPSFLLIESLGLIDSRLAIILPGAISTYNMIIMRTAFAAVPESLEESAKIEGANDFQVLIRIFIPVSKAVIAVMLLYYGVAHWNDWFTSMLYLRSRERYPLQMILREILILNNLDNMREEIDFEQLEQIGYTIKYTTIVVATLPVLLSYPFLQKYFVRGVMIGAVKG
ncbi:MAG: carbohydrate ABC transporter permease [Oscillospiraceae bacterium]|nr:carbohydrate ABC transporter permease [Oscillospiraceae bacterium]